MASNCFLTCNLIENATTNGGDASRVGFFSSLGVRTDTEKRGYRLSDRIFIIVNVSITAYTMMLFL